MSAPISSLTRTRAASQPCDVRSLPDNERDRLIISSILVDGTWVIKSVYADDAWHLTGRATNKSKSKRTIDFTRTPLAFRSVVKEVIYRYQNQGRTGQKKPSATTLITTFNELLPFLRHLESLKITHLGAVTPLACSTYVAATRASRLMRDSSKPLSPSHMAGLFKSVELLYELSQFSAEPMPRHPWPESSAAHLAGTLGNSRSSKTPLIPDEVFVALFQRANSLLSRGDALLDLRDALDATVADQKTASRGEIRGRKECLLKTHAWKGGLADFNSALLELRTACYIVVASLSGCRNHELAYLQSEAFYRTIDDEGEVYWWMRSRSDKNSAGSTEWMIPEAAVDALRMMDRWAKPYQALIAEEIESLQGADPRNPEIAEARRHSEAVFLGTSRGSGKQVRTLSDDSWNQKLKSFAKRTGLTWNLTTHQFRRKFANYAARSQFGDLRYLREHFKHWSQDMTNDGYALNDSQEMELYAEIDEELDGIKLGLAEQWLSPTERLAGGYGKNLMDWRSREESVVLFRDHAAMVRSVAESHAIRSNGHAWCTADDKQCIGNTLEKTRCSDCNNAVIGLAHARIYQNLFSELRQLSLNGEIGPGGQARVRRDLARCREVLISLGFDPEGEGA